MAAATASASETVSMSSTGEPPYDVAERSTPSSSLSVNFDSPIRRSAFTTEPPGAVCRDCSSAPKAR